MIVKATKPLVCGLGIVDGDHKTIMYFLYKAINKTREEMHKIF